MRFKKIYFISAMFLLVLFSGSVAAIELDSTSDLDLSFGIDGIYSVGYGQKHTNAGMILQPDGKILLVGSYLLDSNNNDWNFILIRLLANGNMDTTFGSGGFVKTDFDGNGDWASDAALQSDGKIIVAGTATIDGEYDLALVRYSSDGTLDTSFGIDGKVTTDLSDDYEDGFGVVLQSDGKIIMVGEANDDFAVLRYNENGSLDHTFGSSGIVTTDINGSWDVCSDVILQSDGKIIAVGYGYSPGTEHDFALVRYLANGNIDTSFGINGIVTTDISGLLGSYSNADYGNSAVIQSDSKIIVVGSTPESNGYLAMARYNSDGSLDQSFGVGGMILYNSTSCCSAGVGLAIQSDGKIVAVGQKLSKDYKMDSAVWRFSSDGSNDLSFGNGGVVTAHVYTYSNWGDDIVIQSDGKILVSGTGDYNGIGYTGIFVMRYKGENSQVFLPLILVNQ